MKERFAYIMYEYHEHAGILKSQMRASESLELSWQMMWTAVCVVGIRSASAGKAASALNHWPIFPAPTVCSYRDQIL